MTRKPPEIKIDKLSKRFANQLVLDQLDLFIPSGKMTVILGKSGQGKSVLLKHLIALLVPDQGQIFYDQTDLFSLDYRKLNDLRKKIGLLFQDAALFDYLNVFDNVAFPLYEHTDLEDRQIAEVVLENLSHVGLTADVEKFPDELSGGMRKRVGLARALVLDPEVMLYDEPTTGLDPLTGFQITELMLKTQEKLGLTSVVISHNISTSFRIADKIALLDQGKIIISGSADEVKNSNNQLVTEFINKGSYS